VKVAVLTVSDRVSRGEAEDGSGDLLEQHVKATGVKKGHLIESALRYHLRALHELPADVKNSSGRTEEREEERDGNEGEDEQPGDPEAEDDRGRAGRQRLCRSVARPHLGPHRFLIRRAGPWPGLTGSWRRTRSRRAGPWGGRTHRRSRAPAGGVR